MRLSVGVQPPLGGVAALWLSTAIAYFTLAAATILLTSDGRSIATLWPANAVLVALLLAFRSRIRWWTILSAGLCANVAANWLTRGSLGGPLAYSAANLIEVAIATKLLLPHMSSRRILGSLESVARFLLVAGLLAPLISGIIGASTAAMLFDQNWLDAFSTWFASDSLGLLLFTPLFYAVLSGDLPSYLRNSDRREQLEAAILLSVTALIAWYCFYRAPKPMLFLLFPPLVLVAFRVGRLGIKVAVVLVALIASLATIQGFGPATMISAHPAEQAQAVQFFLAILLMTCLPISAEVTARTQATKELERREQHMAAKLVTDPLTNIANRVGFEEQVTAKLSRGEHGCLVAIDLDRFKSINDFHGHHAGDAALKHVAIVLTNSVRSSDVVGRLSGDEFALFLAGHQADEAKLVCDRARAALRDNPVELDGGRLVEVRISCGVSSSNSGSEYASLLRSADLALYRAKARGRDAVEALAA